MAMKPLLSTCPPVYSRVSVLRWLAGAALSFLVVGVGCAAPPGGLPDTARPASAVQGARLLTPVTSLTGALVAPGFDRTGTPLLRGGATGFQRFVHPGAVAGEGAETYIADSGTGAIYRFDAALNRMAVLPGVRAVTGTQLYLGPDLSLYVLDPPGRRVLQFARSGQLLATFQDRQNLGTPVDVALDRVRGRVLVADALFNHLVAFHPLGGAAYVIPLRAGERDRVMSIAAMAVGTEGIFLSDPICHCIVQVSSEGNVLGAFGHEDLNQPGAIAVDAHGRIFVVDTFDNSLKVFVRGAMVHRLAAAALGLQRLSDVSVTNDWITLSDGAGARVDVMRIVRPGNAP